MSVATHNVRHSQGTGLLRVYLTGSDRSTYVEGYVVLVGGEWPTDRELAYLLDAGLSPDGAIRTHPQHFGFRVRPATLVNEPYPTKHVFVDTD